MTKQVRWIAFLLILVLLSTVVLSACAGSGNGTETQGSEAGETASAPEDSSDGEEASAPEDSSDGEESASKDPSDGEESASKGPSGDEKNPTKRDDVTFVFDSNGCERDECAIVGVEFSKETYEKTESMTLTFPTHAPTGELVTKIAYTGYFVPPIILGTEFETKLLAPLQAKLEAGEIDEFKRDKFEAAWNYVNLNEMRLMVRMAYLQNYPFLEDLRVEKKDAEGNVVLDSRGDIEYEYPVLYFLFDDFNTADKIELSAMISSVGYTYADFERGWESSIGYDPYEWQEGRPCQYPRCVTSISIPESVKTVNALSFVSFEFLRQENGVAYADRWVVDIDAGLKELSFPEGVLGICDNINQNFVFSTLTVLPQLEKVTIPDSMKYIGVGAFEGETSLQGVYINDLSTWFDMSFGPSVDPVGREHISNPLYYAEKLYVGGVLATEIVVPEGVTEISQELFYNCTSLESVTLAESVTRIGKRAFSGCRELTSVTIPQSVTSIEDDAFAYCYRLVEVYDLSDALTITAGKWGNGQVALYALVVFTEKEIPSRVWTNESGYRFYEDADTCYLLGYLGAETNLTMPTDCHGKSYKIYQGAFRSNQSITDVTLSAGVTSIGETAFSGCLKLARVTVSECVTSIGDYAFFDCSSLTSVTFAVVEGWSVDGNTISETELSDPVTAAQYVVEDYVRNTWTRS